MKTTLIDLLNCIFQGIIAVAAIIAIWITIKQIGGKTNVNLRMRHSFRLHQTSAGESYVELVIHIVNLSMAPVYIQASGVKLWRRKGKDQKIKCFPIYHDPFVLKSGETKTVCGKCDCEAINDCASLGDKIRIYSICQMDKYYYEKRSIKYADFKHESDKITKRVETLSK